MITKVLHGSRVRGLLEYLWGPGRHEEHENPHIVAAWDPGLLASGSVDSFERGLLAAELDAPRRLHKVWAQDRHVYHVPISLHRDDGELSDEHWREIAEYAAGQLGFTEGPGRAAVPWIAVRHGKSAKGNDHIHLVATLIREDGRVAEVNKDFLTWSDIRGEMEKRFDLTRTRSKGAGMPGLSRGEMAKADREGLPEAPRTTLARVVRAAASSARDEADFVRRVRRANLLIRPRWEPRDRRSAAGYSVAVRPRHDTSPIWYGGGKLAEDLTLPELRARWGEASEEQLADATREWRPRGWRKLPTGRQVVWRRLREEAWGEAGRVTATVRTELAGTDPTDTAAWAGVAREGAGALAALAHRVEHGRRGPLGRAADSLARAAQTEHAAERARRTPELAPLAGVARVAIDAIVAAEGGAVGVAMLVVQLGRLVREVEKTNRLAGRIVEAEHAAAAAREMLGFVRDAPTDRGPERNERTTTRSTSSERDVARAVREAAHQVKDRDRHE